MQVNGVDVTCFDGDYYVELRDYEALLKELQDLKKRNEIDEED